MRQAVQLTDLWSAALAQGAAGKSAALDSARSVLNFGLSLTPGAGAEGAQLCTPSSRTYCFGNI